MADEVTPEVADEQPTPEVEKAPAETEEPVPAEPTVEGEQPNQ